MAQNWTNTVSSIGTASRNFIDPTTWDAAFPSDFKTGGGVNHVGLMFADSDFTDVNLNMGPSTLTNTTNVCTVKLTNAVGEKPIWKPGAGSEASTFLTVNRTQMAAGITFDGSTRNTAAGNGLIIASSNGPNGPGPTFISCTFKNSSSHGTRLATTSSAQAFFFYCLAFDNFGSGFRTTGPTAQTLGTFVNCGSGFNGLWGYASLNSGSRFIIRNSWGRSNPSGNVEIIDIGNPELSSHNVIDDDSFTIGLGLTLGGSGAVNVLENATQANFAFVNEAGRDFTPGVGSVLLGEGPEFGSNQAPLEPFDLNRARVILDWGNRLDVGPIQSSAVVAAAAGATPTAPIPAYLQAMKTHYLSNSTAFLGWIQSNDAGATAIDRVRLGYRPQTEVITEVASPIVFIRWENLNGNNAGSGKAFFITIDLVVEHVWVIDELASNDFIKEMNFISDILNEVVDIGIPFDSVTGFGGHLLSFSIGTAINEEANDRTFRSQEVIYTIAYGHT